MEEEEEEVETVTVASKEILIEITMLTLLPVHFVEDQTMKIRLRYKEKHGQNRNALQCYYCKRYGHIEKNYNEKAKDQTSLHEEKDASEDN